MGVYGLTTKKMPTLGVFGPVHFSLIRDVEMYYIVLQHLQTETYCQSSSSFLSSPSIIILKNYNFDDSYPTVISRDYILKIKIECRINVAFLFISFYENISDKYINHEWCPKRDQFWRCWKKYKRKFTKKFLKHRVFSIFLEHQNTCRIHKYLNYVKKMERKNVFYNN